MNNKKAGQKYEKVPADETELTSHKMQINSQDKHDQADQSPPIEVYNPTAKVIYSNPNHNNVYVPNLDEAIEHIDTMTMSRPWHYGLFVCCANMDSCLESFFCLYCQISRQFNMLYHNQPTIHYPMCLLVMFLDQEVGKIIGCLFLWTLRQNIRRRYGIAGSTLGDACTSCWCTPCATQQQLLELTSVGMFPGACCYEVAPLQPQML